MKKLIASKLYYPATKGDDNYSAEFEAQLQEDYVDQLQKLGFKFKGYYSINIGDQLVTMHTLSFEHDGNTTYRPDWLIGITDRDDEGTSSSGHLFFGTLIVTLIATW